MPKKQLRLPAVVAHASGQDVVFLRDPTTGKRKTVYLGASGTSAAAARYREVVGTMLAGLPVVTSARKARQPVSEWPTIAQLAAAYLIHCGEYYVDEHKVPTRHVKNLKLALRPLLQVHRDTATDRFTVSNLTRVRQVLVDEGRCNRRTVNQRIQQLRAMFRWGVTERLVPGSVWHELAALQALTPHRGGVREGTGLRPVDAESVNKACAELSRHVAALVRFCWLTGARMGEAVQLATAHVDMTGKVWLFRPPQHKTKHRGKERIVPIGPQAQALLREWIVLDPERRWFRPCDAVDEHRRELRENRKTPLWPSHMAAQERKRRERPRRPPGDEYDTRAVGHAITRACVRAKIQPWTPHQLRHAALSRIRAEHGLEAAASVGGHWSLSVTEGYTKEARSKLAADIALRLG